MKIFECSKILWCILVLSGQLLLMLLMWMLGLIILLFRIVVLCLLVVVVVMILVFLIVCFVEILWVKNFSMRFLCWRIIQLVFWKMILKFNFLQKVVVELKFCSMCQFCFLVMKCMQLLVGLCRVNFCFYGCLLILVMVGLEVFWKFVDMIFDYLVYSLFRLCIYIQVRVLFGIIWFWIVLMNRVMLFWIILVKLFFMKFWENLSWLVQNLIVLVMLCVVSIGMVLVNLVMVQFFILLYYIMLIYYVDD